MALHRPNLDAAGRAAEVDELIDAVGLGEFQDVRAGSEIIRGLSSGGVVDAGRHSVCCSSIR